MWAAATFEPMAAKSVAADVIISGAAITYDMSVHLRASPLVVTSPAVLHPVRHKQGKQDVRGKHE
jgi:hypothetical protein